ncbi:TlpA family protein disulfide reductase [Alteraurantiacibacter aestuarii]|uniref:Redoxin family protein n=1 Tax=Alteraurantiacibacter aestuarii TaxID=650004 RepID=A0A844ZQS3_9SPHN|nr:TlpA disulfide reductase family protein [Alteraurantiacibacter aestuarii]MXO87959.1 redoxin family protein [Alteraurantiacibacter aestuarii]
MAAALAGCDTGEADPAQGGEEVSSETGVEEFTGTLDRTFAGEAIPAVMLSDPAGITMELADSGDRPILLNLWATWCAPCVVEMPLLDALAGELGEDVRVLTVSEDLSGADAVVPFFEERGFTNLPRWMDPNNDLAIAFGGGAVLPLTVLYNADGKEVWRVIGSYDWGSEEARVLVQEALADDG